MLTKIAFQGLHLLLHPYQLHRAKRAGDRAAFAADTAALLNVNCAIAPENGPIRADAGAGRAFAMMAGYGSGKRIVFNHPDAGSQC